MCVCTWGEGGEGLTVAGFAYDGDDDDDDDDKCVGFMAPRVLPLLPSTLFLCRVLNYCYHIFLPEEPGPGNFWQLPNAELEVFLNI